MFYEPHKNNHGLKHAPFKSCIVPRPIAWISTVNARGIINLAPFSQSNILGWDPPYVMFSAFTRFDGRRKDSVANAEETGEFVFNMATFSLRDAVVLTSAIEDVGVDEMAQAGLTPIASTLIKPPRVAECPISMECKHYQTTVLPSDTPNLYNSVVVGRVLGIHISDDIILPDGKLDMVKARPLARMGYLDYTSVTDVFELRPKVVPATMVRGMSGGHAAS
jgi:flavin reductase (DIM6/NTAB) family NADH-FMN oxidoreductase RutF